MQAECCQWWRHNKFEEPSSHEASFDVRMMRSLWVTRRLRESSCETFVSVRRDKRGSSSLYSQCSTTVNWLTYWWTLNQFSFCMPVHSTKSHLFFFSVMFGELITSVILCFGRTIQTFALIACSRRLCSQEVNYCREIPHCTSRSHGDNKCTLIL